MHSDSFTTLVSKCIKALIIDYFQIMSVVNSSNIFLAVDKSYGLRQFPPKIRVGFPEAIN
jgi:hypothetical protein